MPDLASLSFDIDSSQAQRAVSVLETLKASSITLTQNTNQLRQANTDLTTSYSQERDQLVRLADQTRAYDGTLSGLIDRVNALRRGINGSAEEFRAYAQILTTATAQAIQFNSTVDGLDRYVAKAKELRVTTADLATGFQRMTEALRNQTLEGHQTRIMLEQLGVSASGISASRPDVLLQRLADQLRNFRDSQQKVQAVQQVLGPSFDAQSVLALQNQPFQTYQQRLQQGYSSGAQAQIDSQQAAIQRLTIQLQRNDAERSDLGSRFTLGGGFLGRLGLNPFAGVTLTNDQQLAELRRINQLPANQRSQYEGYGTQFGRAVQEGYPGQFVRNLTSGTFSSNQSEIYLRAQQDQNASRIPGGFGALPGYLGRSVANVLGLYTPQDPTDRRRQSPLEQLLLRQQASRVIGSYGDPSLAIQLQTQTQLRGFGGADVQQRYREGFGSSEGTRRYTNQLALLQQQSLYAQRPELQTQDEIDRERYILSLPAEQRGQARAAIQALPEGQRNIPIGTPLSAIVNSPTLRAGERGTPAFRQEQAGQAQQQSEDIERQIGFQKDLSTALERGRGAAEDFTRTWQAYTSTLLASNDNELATTAALGALNLALAQRVTQGKALVQQLREENDLGRGQIEAIRGTVGADVQTRRGAEIGAAIAADRERLISAGQLPNARGGSFRDPKTGITRTVDAPEAQRVINDYEEQRRRDFGNQGVRSTFDIISGSSQQVQDAQKLVEIMHEQNVSLERAQALLQTTKQLDEASAKAKQDGANAADHELQTAKQRTTEAERQLAILTNMAQNLNATRDLQVDAQIEHQIARAPPAQQAYLRARAQAAREAYRASEGGTGAGQPPIAATELPPEAQALLRAISPSEAGSYDTRYVPPGSDRPATFDVNQGHPGQGAAGLYQFEPDTWRSVSAAIGAHDMSPANQDRGAWYLAQQAYKQQRPGRDLLTDLHDPARRADVAAALRTQWPSIVGGSQQNATGASFIPRLNALLAGGTPAQTGLPAPANDALLGRNAASDTLTREQQETADLQQQTQFRTQQELAARRLELLSQGRTGAAERLQPADPYLPPDLARQQQQRAVAGVVTAQQSQAAGNSAQTRQATADLTRETEALNRGLNGGAAALREAEARIQAHAEALRLDLTATEENARAQELLNRSAAEAGKSLAANTLELQKNQELQKALNARGPFASDLDLAKTRRDVELQQRFRDNPGLEQSEAGQQAIAANQAQDAIDKQTQAMNDWREAAHSAGQAVTGAFEGVVSGSESARDGALSLVKAFEQIAVKALVIKPLERLFDSAATDLFSPSATDKSTPGGAAAGKGDDSGPSLLGRAWNWVSGLFGGGAAANSVGSTVANSAGGAAANDNAAVPTTIEGAMAANGGALPVIIRGYAGPGGTVSGGALGGGGGPGGGPGGFGGGGAAAGGPSTFGRSSSGGGAAPAPSAGGAASAGTAGPGGGILTTSGEVGNRWWLRHEDPRTGVIDDAPAKPYSGPLPPGIDPRRSNGSYVDSKGRTHVITGGQIILPADDINRPKFFGPNGVGGVGMTFPDLPHYDASGRKIDPLTGTDLVEAPISTAGDYTRVPMANGTFGWIQNSGVATPGGTPFLIPGAPTTLPGALPGSGFDAPGVAAARPRGSNAPMPGVTDNGAFDVPTEPSATGRRPTVSVTTEDGTPIGGDDGVAGENFMMPPVVPGPLGQAMSGPQLRQLSYADPDSPLPDYVAPANAGQVYDNPNGGPPLRQLSYADPGDEGGNGAPSANYSFDYGAGARGSSDASYRIPGVQSTGGGIDQNNVAALIGNLGSGGLSLGNAAGAIMNFAKSAGKGSDPGSLGSLFSHAGGPLGWLTDKIGGQGFYQGGGLIGSLFGGKSKGGLFGGGGNGGGSSYADTFGSGPQIGDFGTDPFSGNTYQFVGGGDASTVAAFAPDSGAFAKGAVFGDSRMLRAYENQVVEAPTMFRFASGGQVGMMGEAGPEAILPLKRGTDGKLGISSDRVHQAAGPTIHNWNIRTPDADSFQRSKPQVQARVLSAVNRAQARNSF